jgi:hypothetical protein
MWSDYRGPSHVDNDQCYATHTGKEYKVAPATKITVNGQPAQLSGVATGMNVVIAPAADGVTAATIDAKTRR